MKDVKVFVDRRRGRDRRVELDLCREMRVDMYHRKRRKSRDRRHKSRTLAQDYYAYTLAGEAGEETH
ncbi:hypothetical protein FKG94_24820 [Exilibacterium tricleocarpae]|uniref:Uncharacterized protein n=1 Tax=Exilibacterium tricleocarpae TaxID=2591008 RepID=A0A545SS09_9GAMM|nr:hypothetical protein [Exilibacterium tricleocarpae]TQV67757.1 hypothetical protein FKG94_24820 [Exilibacterium tricleocarpae]